jgi:hypothetical protein
MVLNRAEPEGPAGVVAVRGALADAANAVVQHLVEAAGGREEGANHLVSLAPKPVAFNTNVPAPPLESNRTPQGMAEGRSRLRGDLSLEIEHYIYVALFASTPARMKLAPLLSPTDLPKEVDPELNLTVSTTDEWRRLLFDDRDRLVVPSPFDADAWIAFLGWIEKVNPSLLDAVRALTEAPFHELFL